MDTKKDKFLALISHKLLTPATIIKWNAELLEQELNSTGSSSQRLSDIIKSNEKQIAFITQLLDEFKNVSDFSELESFILNKFEKRGN